MTIISIKLNYFFFSIDKCKTNHPYSGRNYVNIINILVKTGVIQQGLISDLITKANDFEPFQNSSVIDMNSSLDFLYGIFEETTRRHPTEHIKVSEFLRTFLIFEDTTLDPLVCPAQFNLNL